MTQATTICMLGTGTKYTDPRQFAGAASAARCDTLGFIANLICCTGEVTENAHAYNVPGIVHVINGPDALGTIVAHRIDVGLLLALAEILHGKSQINFIAHSRGAIESILIAHKLSAIKEIFNQHQDPVTAQQTVSGLMVELINSKKFSQSLTKTDLECLKNNLNQIQIGIFNIDPVPGGNIFGIPIRWNNDLYYTIPKIVTKYTQLIYTNERSRAFKTIIPKCDATTEQDIFILPGHHGTGSGNLLDQNKTFKNTADFNSMQTKDVQELLILKLIEFLYRNGVEFLHHEKFIQKIQDQDLKQLIANLFDHTGKLSFTILNTKKLNCYTLI